MGKTFEKRKLKTIKSEVSHLHSEEREASLPNSLVMRIMEDQQAEQEADQLSTGVNATTPDALREEMGARLGADFSDVQFHSDTMSMNRSKALGARAWAQGSDVYFGKGGFDPKVAAHELVHTVQQGAVHGNTEQSAPYGAVQLFHGENEENIQRRQASANASTLQLMQEQKQSSEYGARVFSDLVKPTKQLAEKSGSRVRAMNDQSSMAFLANLSERDYSGKEIIRDIATRTVINKDEMYDRIDEYESFIDFMGTRTNKVGINTAAVEAGILDGNLINDLDNNGDKNKRAYEMTEEELANDGFNPMHDPEIDKVLKKIDNARTAKEAYYIFLGYTENKEYTAEEINNGQKFMNFAQQPVPIMKNDLGDFTEVDPLVAGEQKEINDDIEAKIKSAKQKMQDAKTKGKKPSERDVARQEFKAAKAELLKAQGEKKDKFREIQFRYKQGASINKRLLKAKLKNMIRQVHDYPELKNKIGAMNVMWNQKLGTYRGASESAMSVQNSPGASEKAMISYDAYVDRDSPEAEAKRHEINAELSESIGNLNNLGNHELGHVLESTLNTEEEDQKRGKASHDILKSVLPKVMTADELNQVQYNQQDGLNKYEKKIYQGQIDTTSPIFKTKKMSSSYGQSMPKEWFAEAFHDVYTKGAGAKPTSIEIVKEYEKRQTAKQKSGFQKKGRGWLTRVKRWFSKKFNYGQSHNAPHQALINAVPDIPQPNIPQMHQPPAAGPVPMNAMQEPIQPNIPQIPELQLPEAAPQLNAGPDSDMIVEAPKKKKLKRKKKK